MAKHPRWTTNWLGRPQEHYDAIGSTNDRALAWAKDGAPHGALVTADRQTAGRGTRGRAWNSPAGKNVYASIILVPPPSAAGGPQGLSALGLVIGLGLHLALSPLVPGLNLKWPNDVVVVGPDRSTRKLAGILCETRWVGDRAQVVVGFGINVRAQEFPADLLDTAISIEAVTGEPSTPDQILSRVLEALEPVIEQFFAGGFAAVAAAYRQRCITIGQQISRTRQVRQTQQPLVGVATGLTPEGALEVRTDAGEIVVVHSVG